MSNQIELIEQKIDELKAEVAKLKDISYELGKWYDTPLGDRFICIFNNDYVSFDRGGRCGTVREYINDFNSVYGTAKEIK